jgi:hypothetical protein
MEEDELIDFIENFINETEKLLPNEKWGIDFGSGPYGGTIWACECSDPDCYGESCDGVFLKLDFGKSDMQVLTHDYEFVLGFSYADPSFGPAHFIKTLTDKF